MKVDNFGKKLMETKEKIFAVFGNPIEHSRSPKIHSLFSQQTKINIIYRSECINLEKFSEAVKNFFSLGGSGLNVTVPFKTEAFVLSDELSKRASNAGAVNTLFFKDGCIHGDNTDGVGLLYDLEKNLKWKLKGANILIIGAGGAARGIIEPILHARPSSLTISNRTIAKADNLVDIFYSLSKKSGCEFKSTALDNISDRYDIIINATSLSLDGRLPDLSPDIFLGSACYDLMYSSQLTNFLSWAKENGAITVADGLGMLVEQAAESFFLWHGIRPETESVIQEIRQNI